MKVIHILFIVFIFLGCKENIPFSKGVLVTSDLIEKEQIKSNLKKYIDHCKLNEDTVKVLILNIEAIADSTIIYVSSVKDYSFIKNNYPTAFTFFDKILVLIFTGSEKIMVMDLNNVKNYLHIIKTYSREKNLAEYTLHNPINWAICVKGDTITLNRFLSEDVILDKIYHLKPSVKPKIYFHKDSL